MYDMAERRYDSDQELVLAPARPKLQRPPMFHVILNNDDFTPMDYVVNVLERFFSMAHEQALQTMLEVHTRGKAVAGTYTAEIAETKAAQVNNHAREHEHPLLCTLERL